MIDHFCQARCSSCRRAHECEIDGYIYCSLCEEVRPMGDHCMSWSAKTVKTDIAYDNH